jgi:uncharacterized protein (TIGR02284 family)
VSNESVLNKLLTRNYDAEKGFKTAAENTKNPSLKSYFQRNSQMHYDFGHQLKSEISKIGGSPDKGSSVAGDAHRGWMDLKASVSSDNDEAILEECERGQKKALNDYEDALSNIDDTTVTSTLSQQKAKIAESVNELKRMEEKA